MSIVVVGVISVIGVLVTYLAVAATLCVLRDRSLALKVSVLRILISWFVPLLGPILITRVAIEESPHELRSCWWLWPLRPLLSDETPGFGFSQEIDVRADAERILPGSTLFPPP
jgi:Na+/proline symporter